MYELIMIERPDGVRQWRPRQRPPFRDAFSPAWLSFFMDVGKGDFVTRRRASRAGRAPADGLHAGDDKGIARRADDHDDTDGDEGAVELSGSLHQPAG